MTESYEWRGRIGEIWAEEWRRTDRTLAPVNAALVARARAVAPVASPHILDIGCGAGATSVALADAMAGADICGIDLSQALVAVARARTGDRAHLRFEAADASEWTPSDGRAFDLLVSRHGVMFFDEPVSAFAHIRSLAGRGTSLVFSCFRPRGDNPWVRALGPIVARFAPEMAAAPEPPAGPFAFGDPAKIRAILGAAGFAAPDIAPLDFDLIVGEGESAEAAIADATDYFCRVGPFAALLRTLDEAAEREAVDQLRAIVATHADDRRAVFRAAAWIVTSKVP